jgi:hypothetical protein
MAKKITAHEGALQIKSAVENRFGKDFCDEFGPIEIIAADGGCYGDVIIDLWGSGGLVEWNGQPFGNLWVEATSSGTLGIWEDDKFNASQITGTVAECVSQDGEEARVLHAEFIREGA